MWRPRDAACALCANRFSFLRNSFLIIFPLQTLGFMSEMHFSSSKAFRLCHWAVALHRSQLMINCFLALVRASPLRSAGQSGKGARMWSPFATPGP